MAGAYYHSKYKAKRRDDKRLTHGSALLMIYFRWWLHSWAQRAAFGNFHSFIYYVYRSFAGAYSSPNDDGESGGLSG
jgi:hypothetical protein